MRETLKLLQGNTHSLFYWAFFLWISVQWLFCELPRRCSAEERSEQFRGMFRHDTMSTERTAVAVRMPELPDADGFPTPSSWELTAPQRFNADWQGKNADPERETEVRLLWTPESLYLQFRAKYRVITIFSDAEPNGRRSPFSGHSVVALPMKCLVDRFDPAATWRVNFYRVEGAAEPRFYSAWQPTRTPAPNFHVPEAFGELVFAASNMPRK